METLKNTRKYENNMLTLSKLLNVKSITSAFNVEKPWHFSQALRYFLPFKVVRNTENVVLFIFWRDLPLLDVSDGRTVELHSQIKVKSTILSLASWFQWRNSFLYSQFPGNLGFGIQSAPERAYIVALGDDDISSSNPGRAKTEILICLFIAHGS